MHRLSPLALLAALLAGCIGGRSPRVEPLRSRVGPPPAALSGPVDGRILVFGDFGEVTTQQAVVARAILEANRRRPFDVALHVGDNLNPCGPDLRAAGTACRFDDDGSTLAPGSVARADPRFADLYEQKLLGLVRADGSPVRTYMAIGNHDIKSDDKCRQTRLPQPEEERLKACIEVAHRGPQWTMPARHYVLEQGSARFIVIDGLLLTGDYGGFRFDDELAFVEEAAKGCDATHHCFLASHYYPSVAGPATRNKMPGSDLYTGRVAQVEQAMGGHLAAWLCGHAHDLQHLRDRSGTDVFIAGNTSAGRVIHYDGVFPSGSELEFFSVRWGFGVLEVHPDGWDFTFLDDANRPLHCCRAVGAGRCEPYACAGG